MKRYSDNHSFRLQPKAPHLVKSAQTESVWDGPAGVAGLEIDYDDAWDLWCAAIDGHLPTIEEVIAKDPRTVNVAFRYHCPLDMAIYGGHLESARLLIDAGTELCFKYGSHHWERMTRVARDRGHGEIAELLVQTAAKRFNYHPDIHRFFDAFRSQDPAQLKQLLDEQPDRLHIADMNGNTLLHWAVMAWQVPMVETLVECGADMNRENGAALVPHRLQREPTCGYEKGMREGLEWREHFFAAQRRLVELGADEDDIWGDIRREDYDAVRARVEKSPGCLHDFRGKQMAPLTAAVGNIEMVRLLLELGADPKVPEVTAPFGEALYTACCRHCPDTVRLLLEQGADPWSYSDSSGDCYMAAACWGQNREEKVAVLNEFAGAEWTVLEYSKEEKPPLKEVRARVREVLSWQEISDWQVAHLLERITHKTRDVQLLDEYVNRLGDRAIDEIKRHPVPNDERPMFKRLLELGAPPPLSMADLPERGLGFAGVLQSPMGQTYAHEYEHRVKEFVAAGGDVNAVDHYDMTSVLSIACADGDIDLAKQALELGADPNIPPQDGYRPIERARKGGHDEIVKLLEKVLSGD